MADRPALTRITADNGPWPLHNTAASRAAEQAALANAAPHALMERAGLASARLALALAPHAAHVTVWAGPGNNGGDGLVAARHLHAAGRRVQVRLVADPARLPTDAALALRHALAAGVPVGDASARQTDNTGLVIDALLGLGARRAPEGALREAIVTVNASAVPVLAVDIASGLHPDTGAVLGAAAVRAHATLCLLTLKPGCFTAAGRDHAGTVWLDTLSVPSGAATAWLSSRPVARRRAHATHKGSFGDVAVVGGAAGMAGAAWLAARAALAAGAGRVFCCPLDPHAATLDPSQPELMVRPDWWQQSHLVLSQSTVVCGCGGGDAVREALPALLSNAGRLVLDADALNAIACDGALQQLLKARSARGGATLLTPHPLEAARLLQTQAADIQQDRLAAATALSGRFGCTVLLKGSGSVIGAPGQPPRINPTGNAALATAGTGDVLAGWCGGLWSQQPGAAPADVATAAAWLHGHAADTWAASGHHGPLRAAALVEAMLHAD